VFALLLSCGTRYGGWLAVCASHCMSEGRTLVLIELQAGWAGDPVWVLFRREKFLPTAWN
jgi:hypothetical protein